MSVLRTALRLTVWLVIEGSEPTPQNITLGGGYPAFSDLRECLGVTDVGWVTALQSLEQGSSLTDSRRPEGCDLMWMCLALALCLVWTSALVCLFLRLILPRCGLLLG